MVFTLGREGRRRLGWVEGRFFLLADDEEYLIDWLALVAIIDDEKRISNIWCYFHNKTIRTGLSKGYLEAHIETIRSAIGGL